MGCILSAPGHLRASTADIVVISAEEGVAKPDLRIFQLTVERLGVQPEEVIFVDDTLEHVHAVQTLGMRALLFRQNTQAIAQVRKSLEKV